MKKDKNGFEVQEGLNVRLTQTEVDHKTPTRVYEVKEIDGELFVCLPLSELQNSDSENYSVETVR